jgi:NADH-quinone oxidoreductase subunit M
MILIWLIGILLVAGILAWLTARWSAQLPRWISLIAIGADLVLAARIWVARASSATELWLDEVDWNWVPSFGIHFHLAVDGLSLLMLLLTFFLVIMAVLASCTEIREQIGFFHFNLMWVLAGNRRRVPGHGPVPVLFSGVDAGPMFFSSSLGPSGVYAAVKFSCSQFSGLLMLIAIPALYAPL